MQVNCILSIFALYTSFWYVYKFEIVYAEIFLFNYLFFSNYQFAFKISIFRNSNSRKEMISLCNLSLRSSNTYHQMRTVKKCAVFGDLRKKTLYRGFILNTTLCHSLSDVFVHSYTYRTKSKLKTEFVVLIWH